MNNYIAAQRPGVTGGRKIGAVALGLLLASVALPASVMAQDASKDTSRVEGPYLGLGAGINLQNTENYSGLAAPNGMDYSQGVAVAGTFGYKYGNGIRVELEIAYRDNGVSSAFKGNGTGDDSAWTGMINGLYDIDTGGAITPYLGAGIGIIHVDRGGTGNQTVTLNGTATEAAMQAIAGVSFAINYNLKLDLSYHYLTSFTDDSYSLSTTHASVNSDYESHTILAGLRWEFGQPPAAPVAAPPPPPPPPAPPPPAPAPAPQPPQTQEFIIYFAFDSANLDEAAKSIVKQVIAYNQSHPGVRIALAGHTDLAGSPDYNVRLSLRRADAVRAELLAQGVGADRISVTALGESQPAVPTAVGVREPLNRRVVIDLR